MSMLGRRSVLVLVSLQNKLSSCLSPPDAFFVCKAAVTDLIHILTVSTAPPYIFAGPTLRLLPRPPLPILRDGYGWEEAG